MPLGARAPCPLRGSQRQRHRPDRFGRQSLRDADHCETRAIREGSPQRAILPAERRRQRSARCASHSRGACARQLPEFHEVAIEFPSRRTPGTLCVLFGLQVTPDSLGRTESPPELVLPPGDRIWSTRSTAGRSTVGKSRLAAGSARNAASPHGAQAMRGADSPVNRMPPPRWDGFPEKSRNLSRTSRLLL